MVAEAILAVRIMTSMVVVRKTTKSGPLTTVVRMAVAMRRTMAEAIVTVRIVTLVVVVVKKTTKSVPLLTVARMAVAMMRTMEEALMAVRLMRDNGDDDGDNVVFFTKRLRTLRSVIPRARGPSRTRAVTAAAA